MSSKSVNAVDLEQVYSAAVRKREQAEALQRRLMDAQTALIIRKRDVASAVTTLRSQVVDDLLTKPDFALDPKRFVALRLQQELLSDAVAELHTRVMAGQVSLLKVRADECRAHADCQRAVADAEEAQALDALRVAAGSLGSGAKMEISDAGFQRRREFAADLDLEAERFERQAAEAEQAIADRR